MTTVSPSPRLSVFASSEFLRERETTLRTLSPERAVVRVESTAAVFPVPPILDGEVVAVDLDALQDRVPSRIRPASRLVSAYAQSPIPTIVKSKHRLLQRVIDDPYWLLMSLAIGLGLSIVGIAIYGVIQVGMAIRDWWMSNGHTVVSATEVVILIIVVLALCGGGAAKCAGIHCGGCKGNGTDLGSGHPRGRLQARS